MNNKTYSHKSEWATTITYISYICDKRNRRVVIDIDDEYVGVLPDWWNYHEKNSLYLGQLCYY
jgi:hypothetical protein